MSSSRSVGGLLEVDDRMKFTQYVLTTAGNNKTALPTLQVRVHRLNHCFSSNPLSLIFGIQEGDSLFEFHVNSDSMEWERWVAPNWEYPTMAVSLVM